MVSLGGHQPHTHCTRSRRSQAIPTVWVMDSPACRAQLTAVSKHPHPPCSHLWPLGQRTDIAFGDIAKMLGERWKALSADDRVPYTESAAQDKARYSAAMEVFKAGGGGGAAPAQPGGASKAPGKASGKAEVKDEEGEEEEEGSD